VAQTQNLTVSPEFEVMPPMMIIYLDMLFLFQFLAASCAMAVKEILVTKMLLTF